MNSNIKRIILFILAVSMILIIFNFSSKDTNKSNNTSKELIYKATLVYENITDRNIDNEKIINKLNYPVRKLAHFSLYFFLGLFIYIMFSYSKVYSSELITFIICFTYAVFDEIHQISVMGRTGQVLDVFIDSFGRICAIIIVYFINKKRLYRGEINE